nr:MAG TPA: hypothetical protein [Caudoviricetes sp.]
MYDDRSGIVRPFPEPIALNVVTVLISFHSFGKLPFKREQAESFPETLRLYQ